MTISELNAWIINIENTASIIESNLGADVIKSVLIRYGVQEIREIKPNDMPLVFSELYAIEVDL